MRGSPTQEHWESLANAIIQQAADDYRAARRIGRSGAGTAAMCVQFFRSDRFKQLSHTDGEELYRRLKDECDEYTRAYEEFCKYNIYTFKEAAKILGISYKYLSYLYQVKQVQGMKIGNFLYINQPELERLMEERGVKE